jgi:hypothetical protein
MFDPLKTILAVLLTAGLKEFYDKVLHQPLDANASAAIVVLVNALLLFADGIANLLPATWTPVLGAAVSLIVAIGASFGIHAVYKQFGK